MIELSDIKHTIRGLQAKLERDADTRASLEEKIEILKKSEKIQDKSTTLDLTAEDPKIELMMKISELEEQLTNAKHQEDLKVKDIEAKHEEKMQEFQKQISDLTTEKQEHLDLMDFVKCEKEVLANENKELKSNLKELNVNLNNMVSENKQLHELNLNLEQVKCEILENTNSLSNVNTEMKLKMEDLNEKFNEMLSEMADKDTLLQQKKVLIEEFENTIKNIEEQNAYFENDQSKLTKVFEIKIEALSNENSEMKLKMEDLNINFDKMLSEMADKDTLLQQKKALIEEFENKIKDIEEQNAYFKNDLQTKLSKAVEQKEKCEYTNDALENHIKKLEAKITDMEDSVSFVEVDLRNKLSKEIKEKELLQECATSLKSSMEAVQDVQDKYNQLVIDNEELEIQLKEMESCDNQAYVKTLKEKNAQQTIELASLRVEKVRTEGEQQKIMKRLTNELEGEKGQVKRLKDEIRRIQRQSQQLDSTYVASSRPPLQV